MIKKQILLTVFYFIFSIINAQSNKYFGSAIIQKGEYFVKLTSSNLYWTCNNDNTKVELKNSKGRAKIMFIPAGKGFYHIKFIKSDKYLTYNNQNLTKSKFNKKESQKFKIVRVAKSKFQFRTSNNFAINFFVKPIKIGKTTANSFGHQTKTGYLKLGNNKNQTFEIINAKTNIKLEWKFGHLLIGY